ncbi:MAG: DUF721 domain-containing protein [Austwickia sp.]|nr:DUF721 domain-containing protein [Austwickia sp.]MBK8437317.1 DUF721 domain-containing protein [Austwickia sp.]MBK9102558.1 DUF721 domain-containing protein [Austwickia sp.]
MSRSGGSFPPPDQGRSRVTPGRTEGADAADREQPATSANDGANGGADDGAREALARARAAARAKGLMPGRDGGASSFGASRRTGRGTDRRSAAGADARDPLLVSDAVGRVLSHRGWERDLAIGSIMARWAVIVGLDVARHCEPERFDRGVLTVRAESSAWAAQLRGFAPTILQLLEREVGPGLVLELRILGPGGPSWRRGRLSVRGRGPRDTYG